MLLSRLLPAQTLLWAGETGTGGGETGTGAGDQPGDTGTQTGGATSGSSGFTQADLDRIAGQTRKEALTKWAREHGFADVKEAEAAIKAQKDAQDLAKTELDKAREAETREKTRAEAAEARLTNTVLRSAFDRAAMDKVGDLDLAYLAAQNAGLLTAEAGIVIDVEKNHVSGLDKAVEKLLKDKPILKKTSQAAAAGTGGAESGNSSAAGAASPEKEAAYRRRFGIRN